MAGDSSTIAAEEGVTGYAFTVSSDIAADDYEKDSKKESTQRPARVETRVQANGTGQIRLPGVLTFPCLFKDIPTLAVGSSVIRNPDVANWYDPIGTAGVVAWITDADGLYTGAKIWVRVDAHPVAEPAVGTLAPIPPNSMATMIYMTFSSRATKRVADTEMNDDLTPKDTSV